MAWEPSHLILTSDQDQMQDIDKTVQNPGQIPKPTLSQEASSSQFDLPDGWIVEERPRRANPSHVDRYYYEPHTRKQFRSLSSVQKYLAGEKDITAKRKSKKANNNFTESGVGQQSSSYTDVDYFLPEGNTSRATPKSSAKAGGAREKREKRVRASRNTEQSVRDSRNTEQSVYRPSPLAEKITPRSWRHSIPSGLDYQRKINNPESSAVHNLSTPPPTKVSWLLSGPSGNWNPRIDGLPVPESETHRWSHAFKQSINPDGFNGN